MKTTHLRPALRAGLAALLAGLSLQATTPLAAQDLNVPGNLTVNGTSTLSGTTEAQSNLLADGYFGIGTASPGRPFVLSTNGGQETVSGLPDYGNPAAVITNGGGLSGLRILGTWQGFLQLYTSNDSLGGYLRLIDNGGSPANAYFQLGFDHNSVIAMTVQDSGNVGIGTTTPAYPLDVAGDGNMSGNLTTGGTVNGQQVVVSANINAKVAGNTTIYAPPAGMNFSVTSVAVENVNVAGLTTPAQVTFSAGSTTNNVTNSLTLTSAGTGQEFKAAFTSQPYTCTSTDPLTLRITSASSATTHTIKVVVTGIVY